jgi:glycosyltransferase involved in cell wall biosynthesis
MNQIEFPGRVGLQQRVLPFYRAPFFDALAESCPVGLNVFAGQPRPDESIESASHLAKAVLIPAENIHTLSGKFYTCRQANILDWLQDWQPQILIAEANPRYLSTPSAIRWMHDHGGKVIGWGLGAPQISGWSRIFRESQRKRFLNLFDAMIAYSRMGADEYHRIGFPADRVFVAPNAATLAPSDPAPDRAEDQPPSIVFVGRLQARKRLNLLIRACAALPDPLKPALVIIGEGPERVALETLARQLYPRTVFPGLVTGDALKPYFQQATLFVLPGTGGLAVQQAMSTGLPVLVAEGDGTQSNLVTPQNGWQVIPGSLEDLTRVLTEALSDPARLQKMGAESYRIVKEEINIEKMVEVFVTAMLRTVSP